MERKDKDIRRKKNKEVSISPELKNIVGDNLFENPEEMEEGINRIMGIEDKK